MKWAKTHADLLHLTQGMSPQGIADTFAEYDSLTTVYSKSSTGSKKAVGKRKSSKKKGSIPSTVNFYEWKTYDDLPYLSPAAQRKYEIFCGGFLYFYDHQLYSHNTKTGKDEGYLIDLKNDHKLEVEPVLDYFRKKLQKNILDHELWFDWAKDPNHHGKTIVTIFISPKPGNPDPPTPPPPPPPETSFA